MPKEINQITAVLLRGGRLDQAVLRRRKDRLEVARDAETALPGPGEDGQWPEDMPDRLKQTFPQPVGLLTMGLPSDLVLLRVADLPTTEAEELPGMVDLQVDKFSPFPTDEMQVSFEVMETGESNSLVLIAAVRREAVDLLAEPFLAADLLPDRVDVQLLGWWHLLREQQLIPGEGSHAFLFVDHDRVELILSHNGNPLALRYLGPRTPGSKSTGAFYEDIAEEVAFTLTSLESEKGLVHITELSLWHWDQVPVELVQGLEGECGLSVTPHSFTALPSLSEGLARRAASDQTGLNPAPPEWASERRSQKMRKRLLLGTLGFAAVWVLLLISLYTSVHTGRGRIEAMKREADSKEAMAQEVRLLKSRVELLLVYQ